MLSNMGWKQSYSGLCTGLLLLLLCNLSEQTAQQSQIRIDPDGGYTGIVIKINKDVPQDLCPKILSNIKVSKKIPSGTFTKATKMKVAKGGFKSGDTGGFLLLQKNIPDHYPNQKISYLLFWVGNSNFPLRIVM